MKRNQSLLYVFLGVLLFHLALAQSPTDVTGVVAPTSGSGTSTIEAEVRETVYALLNETGHAVNANEGNVQELVELLMNGTVITDADLIRLGFIPQPLTPPVVVDPTPPPYVIPSLPGVDLTGGSTPGGSPNPAPSTGSGSPSTQPSSGGVIPPSITDIFGIPGSTVVDTSGGAGGSTGAITPQGPGSSTQGGGVVSPGAAGAGLPSGGTDPLGSLLGGVTGSVPTSGSSSTPNAVTDPAAIIPPGAFATGPVTLPGLGTSGTSPNDISSQTNPLGPSNPNALGPKPTDPFGGMGGFGTSPVSPPVMPRPSTGILDTAYNARPKNTGLFSNPLMMMFMFPEMGEMMGGENSLMSFFLMQQMMNRRPKQQSGGVTLMGPGGSGASSSAGGMSVPSGLPPLTGTGSPLSSGGTPNIMDMLNSMGPPPATSGLPSLSGTGSQPSPGGTPNIMDMLNSMEPPPPASGLPSLPGTGSQAAPGGAPNFMDMLNTMGPPPGTSGPSGTGGQLDFASMLNPPSAGMGSPASAVPSMNDFMNMINSGSQTGRSTGIAPNGAMQADPFAMLG